MKSLWSDQQAAAYATPLGLRVYTSRLLGRDPALVLHGGGNTSMKMVQPDRFGEQQDVLFIKGSGWDLETITEAGFTPVRLRPLIRLAGLERLSDPEMVNELNIQRLNASAPAPSVETILHAILPYRYVDHTHADAVLAVTNTADGRRRIEDIYQDTVVIIPYVMPGFDLARSCARLFPRQRNARTIGMVLMNHGVFSFGDEARESYERMIALVDRAERYLRRRRAWTLAAPRRASSPAPNTSLEHARLRAQICAAAGRPMLLSAARDPLTRGFCARADLPAIASRGPATPDHSIRTKRLPLVGRDVAGYVRAYTDYFQRHAARARAPKTMLDPAPRIVLDPELGLCAAGRTVRDTTIGLDLYRHTIEVILRAEALGGYRALSARDIFAVEYWDLEQAKLKLGAKAAEFAGEVALVTGAASGIGKACVDALLERGAAVIALDRDPAVTGQHARPDVLGVAADVSRPDQIAHALERGVTRFGGLDMLILNAGVFPGDAPIAAADSTDWRQTMAVNLDANLALLRTCHPLLKLAPEGGRVVVVGSKNVPAPGPGAAAYSASKAALTQLARVAALEWGRDAIRVNVVHPNGVFDTGLWTPELLQARAARYGQSVEQYRRDNVLQVEVRSRDVAHMVCAMCGQAFARTTGTQVPVDGGNTRVI